MGPLRLPEAQRSSPARKTSLGQQTDVGPGGTACCLLDPLPTRSASGCFSNALSSWHYGGLRGGSLGWSLGARMTSLCWWACSIFQKFRLNITISCGHWTTSRASSAWKFHPPSCTLKPYQSLTLELKLGPVTPPLHKQFCRI